jgi:hypothetical protein
MPSSGLCRVDARLLHRGARIAHESDWVGRLLVFRSPCQHDSPPVCLPRPSLRRESLSPPANSLFTPLPEAKTARFAVHPSRVTHEIDCPGPPTRHSHPFKTHSFRAPTSGLAQRNFKQGAGRSPTTLHTPCVLAPCLKSSAVPVIFSPLHPIGRIRTCRRTRPVAPYGGPGTTRYEIRWGIIGTNPIWLCEPVRKQADRLEEIV